MDTAKKQLAEKLHSATNILVTVSRDPSVDQLAACLGLTLLLNRLNKHTAAVFSGKVPSTIEFLQPEATIEKTTDSLRDFIIALDKSKADKLRYKVEDNVVRIFITPYRTSISQDDLEFSQGDFNVDVVVALGVQQQEDLDEAITAHGRILHDATVTSITTQADSGLGTINWHQPQASSLSELVTELAEALGKDLLDNQIATALLTGIVAETDRFSNDKTTSETMSASAALMSAGANQQLVASKLSETIDETGNTSGESSGLKPNDDGTGDDGTLDIPHDNPSNDAPDDTSAPDEGAPSDIELPPGLSDGSAAPDNLSNLMTDSMQTPDQAKAGLSAGPRLMTEPPTLGGMLTANTQAESLDPVTDPFSMPQSEAGSLIDRGPNSQPPLPSEMPVPIPPPKDQLPLPPTPPAPPTAPLMPNPVAGEPAVDINRGTGNIQPQNMTTATPNDSKDQTLADLEASVAASNPQPHTLADLEVSVNSPHIQSNKDVTQNLDTARSEVNRALVDSDGNARPQPIEALSAQPLGGPLHQDQPDLNPDSTTGNSSTSSSTMSPLTSPGSQSPIEPSANNSVSSSDPNAPPPVPPPIPFQFGSPPNNQPNQ